MNRRSLPLFSLPYWPPDQLRKPVTQKETLSLTQEQTLLKCSSLLNRSWHISTTPNTTKFFFDYFQTNTAILYGHSELPHREKSKFEFEGKKLSLLMKREIYGRFWLENRTFDNKLKVFFLKFKFFIFLPEATQNDHIRLLH